MILLDTNVVIFIALDPGKLSAKAKATLDDARQNGEGLAISGFTLFELAMLMEKRRITPDVSIDAFLHEVESRFVVLPVNAKTCARATALPKSYPKDPADRIIGATAMVEGLSLVTSDRAIRRFQAIHTIW